MVLSHEQVLRWVEFTCKKCGTPELFDSITVRYSKRMTVTVGLAYIEDNEIALSSRFMNHPKYTKEECIDTIVHETCHLVAYYLYGADTDWHGDIWTSLMIKCGFDPVALYHGKADVKKKIKRKK